MRSPIEIITRIRQAGGAVSVLDGDLSIVAPAGTLDDADRAVLSMHKDVLVEALAPVDPERGSIAWVDGLDTEAREQVLAEAARGWDRITGTTTAITSTGTTTEIPNETIYMAIERGVEEVFGEHGVEVEARFDRTPEGG